MNPVEFLASGRTVALDCGNCGTPPDKSAMAGEPCQFCMEPLRYRLFTTTETLVNNIEPTEVVRVLEREKRIDRIAMLMGKSATFAPEPPEEDLVVMEESVHVRATKARATRGVPPVAPPTIVPPAAAGVAARPFPVSAASTIEPRARPRARTGRTPRGLGVLVVTAAISGALWLYSPPSEPTSAPSTRSDVDDPTPDPAPERQSCDTSEAFHAVYRLVATLSPKPADSSWFLPAVENAERLVTVFPRCADAFNLLARARYHAAYDICGAGDYDSAEAAARRALELAPDRFVRAEALLNLCRIAAARNRWTEAIGFARQAAESNPRGVATWPGDLDVREELRPELLATVGKALAGIRLTQGDVQPLTEAELNYVLNASLARYGRRLNTGPLDWFFYCDETPLRRHPKVDPEVLRDILQTRTSKNGVALDNMSLVEKRRTAVRNGL